VPSRKLIKTPEQIEGIRRSGVVNTGVLDLVAQESLIFLRILSFTDLSYKSTIKKSLSDCKTL